MASVSSLDKDLRKMRLDKFTPAAANEARAWIEQILGERLPSSDLLEGLKDGVALCKLINLAVPPPGIKFKASAMPFVQMENISHFLRACQAPPLNLHQHDTFLTVDLYEQKDPAQVLQCIGAFSRAAHSANPRAFPSSIGPKSRASAVSPQGTGTGLRDRGFSVNSNSSSTYSKPNLPPRVPDSPSGRRSPGKNSEPGSPGPVSSWSKREHETTTAPAWNIAQYGYMGGASQGNMGISFGGRRQITSSGPQVPSLADKERRRKEKEVEEERQRQEAQEERLRREAAVKAEEERARLQEERRWEEETRRAREQERLRAEEEKKKWEEEERQWKLTEEKRRKEDEEAEARLAAERARLSGRKDSHLRGQFLSQYQAEQANKPSGDDGYRNRVAELEKELELARQREAEYERERQERSRRSTTAEPDPKARARSRSRPARPPSRQDSWARDEREVLSTAWNQHQEDQKDIPPAKPPRSQPEVTSPPAKPPRPLPNPTTTPPVKTHTTGGRPLPDPAAYSSPPSNRTDRFLSSNPAPAPAAPVQTYSRELGATSEQDAEDRRREASQNKTKAGGWASKSLLEREMEMERQRQREWEEAQKETAAAVRGGNGVDGVGGGVGGRWDVGQWAGYTGGDNQNRGGAGIGAGRRQIVGPRPLPGSNR